MVFFTFLNEILSNTASFICKNKEKLDIFPF